MAKWRVVLHLAYDVDADNDEEAQSQAWLHHAADNDPAWMGAEVIGEEPF